MSRLTLCHSFHRSYQLRPLEQRLVEVACWIDDFRSEKKFSDKTIREDRLIASTLSNLRLGIGEAGSIVNAVTFKVEFDFRKVFDLSFAS